MIDLYLRTATEAAMNAALIDAGLAVEQDGLLQPAEGVALDVIGTIIRIIGEDENGEPVTEVLEGWHVNVRTIKTQVDSLAPFLIEEPSKPYRVWAS